MKRSLGDKTFDYFNIIGLGIIALICVFPIYYVFIVSFTDPVQYYKGGLILFPTNWSLESYRFLLSTNTFPRAIGVSVFLATVGTLLSLIVTSAFSYAISRRRLMGRRLLMLMILLTMLFSPGLIPNYLVVKQTGLLDSIWSLIIPGVTSAWYILLMKGFFDSIPVSLEESAVIDGSSDIGVWWRIILPLSLPALAAFGLFYAVHYWNTYFNAVMYINDFKKMPLQVLLRNLLIQPNISEGGLSSELTPPSETLKMAAVVLATAPIMMVYPFLQKHFAKGTMVGSVKE